MKSGLVTSSVLHAAILTWGLWSFSGPKPLDASYAEALPVEIILSDQFEGVKGEKKAPISEKPAPTPTSRPATLPMTAENTGDNEQDLDTPPTPDKTKNVTPQTGAAKPKAQPKAEPKPAEEAPKVAETPPPPKPPEPKPEPVKEAAKPTPPKEVTPEIDPLAEMIAEDKTEAPPKEEPKAEPVVKNVPVPVTKPKPPTPVKVAEAKPTESKNETGKPTKQNKSDSKKDSTADSDADFEAMAAAVINKQKAAGGGAKRSTDQASLGSERTTGTKLSRSQLGEIQGLLNEQMRRCYSVPGGGSDGDAMKVSIKIQFDPSGAVLGMPEIVRGNSGIAAEAAVRAIRRCAPFNLPAEMYAGGWEETTLNFDPSAMY